MIDANIISFYQKKTHTHTHTHTHTYIYKYLAIKTPNSIQEQNATSTKKTQKNHSVQVV